MLTDQTWEVFDEIVQRIGSNGVWEYAVIRQRWHYEALVEAGFLRRNPERTLEMYGLTAAGRREVCRRSGERALSYGDCVETEHRRLLDS